ncbi:hypothetical protein SAMN05444143_101363 [Flavobacterium succinicans]|uniref:PH domain-containing protein n=1 Tax=Flavobacterium succinicans TaxID=29536 RepID=A0A1I4RH01_9FLAO|nr:hypothetical protein [Flavobacterium succinicans]SFM51568.1 hypothetical protein SAMN05444143_101363 [Flavobacterium succinicans]
MRLHYNTQEQTLVIQDGLKNHHFLLKLLMILNLLNAVLNVSTFSINSIGFMQLVWPFLGLVSIVVLYNLTVKNTTSEKIPVSAIKGLKEYSFFGKKRLAIVLNNGKKRDLVEVKTTQEFKESRKIMKQVGVKDL